MTKSLPYAVALAFLLLGTFSCNEAEETQAAVDRKDTFFSLEKFFLAEEARLTKAKIGLAKDIQINDQKEQQRFPEINYSREFSMFRKADINRPAWVDKYQADTIQQRNTTQIDYKSIDPELKTQELSILIGEDGSVEKIDIISQTETALAGNKSWLTYSPATGYTIKTLQTNRTATTLNILIEGTFIEQ